MSDGAEDVVTSKWITSTLGGDGTLMGMAPGDLWDGDSTTSTLYPLIEFEPQSPGTEIRGVSTETIGMNMLWKIVGVTRGKSYDPIVPIALRIYSLLHGVVQTTVPGGIIMSCVREQAFRLGSVQGGEDYRYLGGLYRVLAQTN